MKTFALTLLLALTLSASFADDISGAWYGVVDIQGMKLTLVFHLTKKDNTYTATLDSPDQHAFGIAVDQVSYKAPSLMLGVSSIGVRYQASYLPDSSKFKGTFYQGTLTLPLELSKTKPLPAATKSTFKARAQDPKSFPYKQEEVKFENRKAGCTLAATLTLPENAKPKSIVILITGSGPQNRNEELMGMNHRPFLVWSDWLTRQGIGVLRYDDRGTAESTGVFQKATTQDFVQDAASAVAYLKSRKDLSGIPIGLLGHSEGGMVAPLLAASNPAISYIVLLAGPGVPIKQLMLKQVSDQNRLAGTPAAESNANFKISEKMFDYILANKNLSRDQLQAGLTKISTEELKKFPQDTSNASMVKSMMTQQIAMVSSPWFRYFIAYDPKTALSQVKCPVLALDGSLDSQVSAEENLAAIREILQKSGNRNAEVKKLDGLNHLFQKATTGAVSEYATIEETVDPSVLTLVSDWIAAQK